VSEMDPTPASCTVITSPEVAFRAGRAFFWRKWRTKWGAVLLGAILINLATLIGVIVWMGPDNWLVGSATKTTSEIEVTADGITVRSGRNTRYLPWKVFSCIWIYEDFILLPLDKVLLNRFVWLPTSGMTPEVLAAFRTAPASESFRIPRADRATSRISARRYRGLGHQSRRQDLLEDSWGRRQCPLPTASIAAESVGAYNHRAVPIKGLIYL
jgi:hypothetical protein